jgi:hypothetical protein
MRIHNDLIDSLLVGILCMSHYFLFLKGFVTELALYFPIVAINLMLLYCLKLPSLRAMLALDWFVVDLLSKGRIHRIKWLHSTKGTFGLFLFLVSLLFNVVVAPLAKEFMTFRMTALKGVSSQPETNIAVQ